MNEIDRAAERVKRELKDSLKHAQRLRLMYYIFYNSFDITVFYSRCSNTAALCFSHFIVSEERH